MLRAATIDGAKIIGFAEDLGSLEAGKLADLVVLSADFLTVPERQIPAIKPVATMVGGKFVFGGL